MKKAIVIVLVLAAGFAVWAAVRPKQPAAGDPKGDARPGGVAAPARIVPVVTAPVQKRDVPIYLEGLGTVVANRTVTVRSQVDGRLDKVLFREGQEVKRGQQIAQIDPRPFQIQLTNAQGALARDRAQLDNGKRNLERFQQLVQKKLIAQQQVDDQAAVVGQLEGTLQIDEGAIASAHLNLDYARIVSPIDGVTGVRLIDPGNLVRASDPTGLVVITQLDPIAVIFTLPEDDLPQVALQLAKERLAVEAFSRDGSTSLGVGQVALIDNQINQATATMRVKALFPNPLHALWPNQFVKARMLLATRREALVIPSSAILRGPEGTFAYSVGKEQTVTARPLEIESNQGDLTLIAKGLSAGEQVVIEGQNQLKPGAKVSARQAGQKQAAISKQGSTGVSR
jgi:multidrug efflux system membrane fusion protein